MDHNHAVETQAVERYLLGELDPAERDSFEEHFFTCAECADEMRIAARFRANVREWLRSPSSGMEVDRGRNWFSWTVWAPAAASVLLLAVVGYQNTVTFPGLRAPRALSEPLPLDGVTRGSLPKIMEGKAVDVVMAVPANEAGVIPELATESGKMLVRGPVEKPVPDQPFRVFFPGEYRPGVYVVILRDPRSGKELTQNKFEIAPKETNTP
jgi:anti-sigma factor RsiW